MENLKCYRVVKIILNWDGQNLMGPLREAEKETWKMFVLRLLEWVYWLQADGEGVREA